MVFSADLSNMTHSDIHSALSQRVISLNPPHLCGNLLVPVIQLQWQTPQLGQLKSILR